MDQGQTPLMLDLRVEGVDEGEAARDSISASEIDIFQNVNKSYRETVSTDDCIPTLW
jgi:hypothetical protein